MKVLVTGAAGFIGYHICLKLSQMGVDVVGVDNINSFYAQSLKISRLNELGIMFEINSLTTSYKYSNLRFLKCDLQNVNVIENLFSTEKFSHVCHLAAHAGVRKSVDSPFDYTNNITSFLAILECCRKFNVHRLVYASSSSVYGETQQQMKVGMTTDNPMSLYAATKKSNELMAAAYENLFQIQSTALRFFSVYGPWGRPDMAYFSFTKAIIERQPVNVVGGVLRDFTYIDDAVNGAIKIIMKNSSPCSIFNVGSSLRTKLSDLMYEIERSVGITARITMIPYQQGDVPSTWADISPIHEYYDYTPAMPLSEGVTRFVAWYKSYYNL